MTVGYLPHPARVVALDVGRRRIGLAISDPSGTIARPLKTLVVAHDALARAVEDAVRELERLRGEDDGIAQIVVGLPVRLDGSPSDQTAYVTAFVERLRSRINVPIVFEDERLTSREAESRLAVNEPAWQKRKERLDAAAAAIILQDYLDRRVSRSSARSSE